MKKISSLSIPALVAATLWMPVSTVNAAGVSVEQRLERLERMTENPVLLQLSRRLGEQQREIQELHDDIDRLKRDLRNAGQKSDKRYKETDDRLSVLESGKPMSANRLPGQSLPVLPALEAQAGGPSLTQVKTPTQSNIDVLASPELPIAPVIAQSFVVATESAATPTITKDKAVTQLSNELNSNVAATVVEAPIENPPELDSGEQPIPSVVATSKVGPIQTSPATELEKAKYQKAFSLMKASQYDASIEAFQQFLDAFPNSDLASNAAYWAGEGHLIKKQNQAALDSFMIVIERYADSSKVADAQLRAADSLANLNRIEDAKKMYHNVINGRPHSRAAQTASKRLNGLK